MSRDAKPDKPIAISPAAAQDLDDAYSENLIPIHDWQKRELDRRQAEYDANPVPFLTWEEVQANILAKYQ